VAHAMLRAVYHLLAEGTTYREPGADYYDRHHGDVPVSVEFEN